MKIRTAKKIVKGDWSRYTVEQRRRAVRRAWGIEYRLVDYGPSPMMAAVSAIREYKQALEYERICRDVKEKLSSFVSKYYKERIDNTRGMIASQLDRVTNAINSKPVTHEAIQRGLDAMPERREV